MTIYIVLATISSWMAEASGTSTGASLPSETSEILDVEISSDFESIASSGACAPGDTCSMKTNIFFIYVATIKMYIMKRKTGGKSENNRKEK